MDRSTIGGRESASAHLARVALRSFQIAAGVLASLAAFPREWLAARGSEDAVLRAAGRVLVLLCNRLGATFIKVGQIASTRSDLLPRPIIRELSSLQDRVPAFAFGEVRRTVESAFGRPLFETFSEFDPEPVAAASVAQVHRARLRDGGDLVAVKVRRPDLLQRLALDRSILLVAARALERLVPSLRMISLAEAVANFCDAVEQQCHLLNELNNNLRFTAAFADDAEIGFPKVYPSACADEVLTMEFIDGFRESELESSGLDPRRIADAGLRCVCRMIFRDGFVHADLHPGNMRFFAPCRVVLLDLGLTGALTDEDRIGAVQLFFALATGDGRTVARAFYDNAPYRATPDYDAYEKEIVAVVESLQRIGLGNIEITVEIGRLFDILRRHRIRARSHMTMVNVALMTVEGLGKRLVPDLNLAEAALPYLAEALGIPMPAGPVVPPQA